MNRHRLQISLLASVALILLLASIAGADACTRVLWNTNRQAKVVARSMDLFRSDEARVVVSPEGIAHVPVTKGAKAVTWTAKYGSVAITAFNTATSDGMNERGLVANMLYLGTEVYPQPDNRPALPNTLWAQYVLDNFATVDEALAGLAKVQVVSVGLAGQTWPLHLSISDASGDSAIIEYVDGKEVVHHGRDYQVMTNEPAYDLQLANVKRYRTFGGTLPLPGDIDPMSRFVRAATFLHTLPQPETYREAVAGVYDVVRNAAVPPGALDTSGQEDTSDTWTTLWITVADSTNKRYYFQSMVSPSVYWIDLSRVDLRPHAPSYSFDAYDNYLNGDITAKLPTLGARSK
jgi:penicillin V acylase-like amidase (Ntn superfamily)